VDVRLSIRDSGFGLEISRANRSGVRAVTSNSIDISRK
jgi:hypothetical protein